MRLAEQEAERRKLQERYEKAWNDSRRRGLEKIVAEFERVCDASTAVFNCGVTKLFREIASETDIFETYHDLERLRVRSERPTGHNFQKLRPQAEIELMGSEQHLDKLHYAALSLDGFGLDGYGDCTVTLREDMICHRASCFEGNSALLYEQEHDFSEFLRSSWAERAMLCVAKTAAVLDDSISCRDFPRMLLSTGLTQDNDQFVEVHVFGTMTAQTFETVAIDSSKLSRSEKTLCKAIKEKLAANGIETLER